MLLLFSCLLYCFPFLIDCSTASPFFLTVLLIIHSSCLFYTYSPFFWSVYLFSFLLACSTYSPFFLPVLLILHSSCLLYCFSFLSAFYLFSCLLACSTYSPFFLPVIILLLSSCLLLILLSSCLFFLPVILLLLSSCLFYLFSFFPACSTYSPFSFHFLLILLSSCLFYLFSFLLACSTYSPFFLPVLLILLSSCLFYCYFFPSCPFNYVYSLPACSIAISIHPARSTMSTLFLPVFPFLISFLTALVLLLALFLFKSLSRTVDIFSPQKPLFHSPSQPL